MENTEFEFGDQIRVSFEFWNSKCHTEKMYDGKQKHSFYLCVMYYGYSDPIEFVREQVWVNDDKISFFFKFNEKHVNVRLFQHVKRFSSQNVLVRVLFGLRVYFFYTTEPNDACIYFVWKSVIVSIENND